ncbi:NYN domain-containing protein [Oceaniglobus roseus]|uniref:NYN domain-containing protein n=1 Tax=Oceaniglobus roseus TaxID=1737570 RepID=UPI000C7F2EBB|nr:NYN domain-containing protein [Kandeliimicrobium roseum]
MPYPRVAVLVDGDNVSAERAEDILRAARDCGRIDVLRSYVASAQSGWAAAPAFRLIHAGPGTNSAGLLLSIDAMELALAGGIETFVIASSDGGFRHVAQRLRERGHHVLGIGEAKAPETFRLACAVFEELQGNSEPDGAAVKAISAAKPVPARSTSTPASATPPVPVARLTELDRQIRRMIEEHSLKGRGMRIADLSAQMKNRHDIRIGSLPERRWRIYLTRRPALYEVDPKSPEAMVRFRKDGFAAH